VSLSRLQATAFILAFVTMCMRQHRNRSLQQRAAARGWTESSGPAEAAPRQMCEGGKRLIDHLHDMGRLPLFGRSLLPPEDRFHADLQVHEQGEAEPILRGAGQNANRAKEMAKDVFALGDILGFLM